MTNNKNAFTAFLGSTQDKYQQSQGNTGGARPVTPPSQGQIDAYKKLCTTKKQPMLDISTMSKREISNHIEALIALPFPPSDSQMQKIHELIAELNGAGVRVNISAEKLATLTGGREGTASQLIEFLFEKRRTSGITDGISDKQVEILVEWFLCPDIPFEEHGISKKFYLDHLNAASSDDTNTQERLASRKWRLVTPSEFEVQVRAQFTREAASRFIDQHRSTFYEWKKTRVTQKKIQFIQTLEQRCASLYVPRESSVMMDVDGNISFAQPSSRENYNPVAYEGMDILQLAQMSNTDADVYIDQLRSALEDKTSVQAYQEHQQDLQDKLGTFNELRQTGDRTNNELEARIREYHKLNDVLFALDSVNGYENDVLHARLTETVLDGKGNAHQFAEDLKEYMLESVHPRTMKIDIARLRGICENSVVASEMLEEALLELIG